MRRLLLKVIEGNKITLTPNYVLADVPDIQGLHITYGSSENRIALPKMGDNFSIRKQFFEAAYSKRSYGETILEINDDNIFQRELDPSIGALPPNSTRELTLVKGYHSINTDTWEMIEDSDWEEGSSTKIAYGSGNNRKWVYLPHIRIDHLRATCREQTAPEEFSFNITVQNLKDEVTRNLPRIEASITDPHLTRQLGS